MVKKLLLSLFPLLSLQASELSLEEDTSTRHAALILQVLNPAEGGIDNLKRYKDKSSITINNEERDIPDYMVSKPLLKMNPVQLAAFLKSGYIDVKECSNGSFSLEEHARLHGGALGGATAGFWFGKALGYGIVVGGVAVVCSPLLLIPGAGPPAYAATVKTGWATTAPLAEGLSSSMAVGMGMVGAVATGPV